MIQIFRSKYKITQKFGADHFLTVNGQQVKASEYYGQYHLAGHEGIDLVPTGTQLDILAPVDGVVVKDDDIAGEPKFDVYGKTVIIWHPSINKATQYCHLKENYVSLGQLVTKGDRIGLMGSTGNTQGAHLHLNLFAVDGNGFRLNKDNGYLGGIDPEPWLEADEPVDSQQIIVAQSDAFIAVATKLRVSANKDVVLSELDKFLSQEDIIVQKDREKAALQNQVQEVKDELSRKMDEYIAVQAVNDDLKKQVGELREATDKQAEDIKKLGTSLKDAMTMNEMLEKKFKDPPFSGWRLFVYNIIKQQ